MTRSSDDYHELAFRTEPTQPHQSKRSRFVLIISKETRTRNGMLENQLISFVSKYVLFHSGKMIFVFVELKGGGVNIKVRNRRLDMERKIMRRLIFVCAKSEVGKW